MVPKGSWPLRTRVAIACLALLLGVVAVAGATGGTLEAVYPDLAQGFLKSALLEPMDAEVNRQLAQMGVHQ